MILGRVTRVISNEHKVCKIQHSAIGHPHQKADICAELRHAVRRSTTFFAYIFQVTFCHHSLSSRGAKLDVNYSVERRYTYDVRTQLDENFLRA